MEEQAYLDMMEKASNWNGFLLRDRSERMPFFDSQTGVTQVDARFLWHKESERFPGHRLDQVFSYPAPRYKWARKAKGLAEENTTHTIFDVTHDESSVQGRADVSQHGNWTHSELDTYLEEDFDEMDDDIDYYDESSYKKRRRRAGVSPSVASSRRSSRRTATDDDSVKPFVCETCGLGYKTKPGLTYHLMKAHPTPAVVEPPPPPPMEAFRPRLPSNICDVCRLEVHPNAKPEQPEKLIVCSECGKAGHPSCLHFNENMIISVEKYNWKCVDCKTCAICGTSENDDVLLFCDDCDRGYHMYCLDPPISEPPEGNWSCRLCLIEFNENAAANKAPIQIQSQSPSTNSQQAPSESKTDKGEDQKSEATPNVQTPATAAEESTADSNIEPSSTSNA